MFLPYLISYLDSVELMGYFYAGNMRQLKGKTKETAREKRQRKQEFRTNKDKLLSVALPAFAGFWLFVIVFIYFSVQPKTISN